MALVAAVLVGCPGASPPLQPSLDADVYGKDAALGDVPPDSPLQEIWADVGDIELDPGPLDSIQCEVTEQSCGLAPTCHAWVVQDCVCVPMPQTGQPCGDDLCANSCADGECLPEPPACDDGIPCTDDGCHEAVGCVHEDGCCDCGDGDPEVCDDSDPCTLDYCSPSFECINLPVDCPDQPGTCSYGACDPGTGACVNAWAETQGRPCDQDGCSDAACDQGGCICPPAPVDSCADAADSLPCDDGNACTADDRCDTEICVGVATYNFGIDSFEPFSQNIGHVRTLESGATLVAGMKHNYLAVSHLIHPGQGVIWTEELSAASAYVAGLGLAGPSTAVYAVGPVFIGQDLATGAVTWMVSGYEIPDVAGGLPYAVTDIRQTSSVAVVGGSLGYVARISADGDVLWADEIPTGRSTAILQLGTGELLVAGNTPSDSGSLPFLTKVTIDGEVLSSELMPAPFEVLVDAVAETANGDWVLVGVESSWPPRGIVIRATANGEYLNSKTFGSGTSFTNSPLRLARGPANAVWLLGGPDGNHQTMALVDALGEFRGQRTLDFSFYAMGQAQSGGVTFFDNDGDTWVTDNRLRTASPCDDGDACNGFEWCDPIDMSCQGGDPPECMDGAVCAPISCDPLTGECRMSLIEDGTVCETPSTCGVSGTCQAGQCELTAAPCDDGNPCTLDTCTMAQTCLHETQWTEGMPCQDGDRCTLPGACQAGACQPGPAVQCDTTLPCQQAACDPAIGCVTDWSACDCQSDGDCDDGDACNGNETCDPAGICTSGLPPDCEVDACGRFACEPGTGCQIVPFFSECTAPRRTARMDAFWDDQMAFQSNGLLVGRGRSTDCDYEGTLLQWSSDGQAQVRPEWSPSGTLGSMAVAGNTQFVLEHVDDDSLVWEVEDGVASAWDQDVSFWANPGRLFASSEHLVMLKHGALGHSVTIVERTPHNMLESLLFLHDDEGLFDATLRKMSFSTDGSAMLAVGGYAAEPDAPWGPLLWLIDVDNAASGPMEKYPADGTLYWNSEATPDGDWIVLRRRDVVALAEPNGIARHGPDLSLQGFWPLSYEGRSVMPFGLQVLADGGYVVSGKIGLETFTYLGIWIGRFSPDNNLIWERIIGPGHHGIAPYPLSDGRNLYFSFASRATTPFKHHPDRSIKTLIRLPLSGGPPDNVLLPTYLAPWLGPSDAP